MDDCSADDGRVLCTETWRERVVAETYRNAESDENTTQETNVLQTWAETRHTFMSSENASEVSAERCWWNRRTVHSSEDENVGLLKHDTEMTP